jgi:GAF domain-containing protein
MENPALDVAALAGVNDDAWPVLEQLARAVRLSETELSQAELAPMLNAVVRTAVETIPPADYAGLVLVAGRSVEPIATTGEPVRALDHWQQDHGLGPCVYAAQHQQPVRIPDTRLEERWAGFGPRAVLEGVLSMMCLPLYVDHERIGTLSLYATRADAFTAQHERVAALFATHAALALAEARRLARIRTALNSRQLIGQATGILMERHRLTSEAAFKQLSTVSQQTNHKLVAVAEHLIETGELPDKTTRFYRAPSN